MRWAKKNPEKAKSAQRRYYQKHKEQLKARRLELDAKKEAQRRKEILQDISNLIAELGLSAVVNAQ